jgi:hypothetical protein
LSHKFYSVDKQYKKKREEFSKKIGRREIWSVIDHWPLYCGMANLARELAVYNILHETLTIPGDIAEFGVWRGGNLMFMAKVMHLFDPHGCKKIYGFDSFRGLTEFMDEDGDAIAKRGVYKGDLDELKALLDLYELQDEVVIQVGSIEETLPKLLAENKAIRFSMIYCDTDLFSSTKTILENLHPRLMKGGFFVFDEWNDACFQGEGVAVNEFLDSFGEFYEVRHLLATRQPTLCLKKIG